MAKPTLEELRQTYKDCTKGHEHLKAVYMLKEELTGG